MTTLAQGAKPSLRLAKLALAFVLGSFEAAATTPGPFLSGTFASIPPGEEVNLSSEGPIDWVHWGLYTESSLDRKAGVVPQISDFVLLDSTNGSAFAFQFSDNANGYSWSDGTPTTAVSGTTTGVWAYRDPPLGTGFQIRAPADTSVRTLKVYVGAFSARGRLEAYLSDHSAPTYVDDSLVNRGNGPSGVYTLAYAAGTCGQQLVVRWSLQTFSGPSGNVTLQAAAITSSTANNLPYVALTGPASNSTLSTGDTLTLAAEAHDLEGTVVNVEFFVDNTKLGEAASSPYSYTWNNVPAGTHVLRAEATDDQGARSTSSPVEIFVNGPGGTLAGMLAVPPSLPRLVNLTAEGARDWAHWGAANNGWCNHKVKGVSQISNFTAIGTNQVGRYTDNYTGYSWTDGAPIATTNETTTGVFLTGTGNGFELALPADTTSRTLKVYVGLYGAQGNFQAWLSDFSAPAWTDTTLSNRFGNAYAAYTLTYSAASAGQWLNVRYRSQRLFDRLFGNVTLQAATLIVNSPGNVPPIVQFTYPTNGAVLTSPASFTIQATASDSDGQVQHVEFFNGSTFLGAALTSLYRIPVDGWLEGHYLLSAVATDDLGAAGTTSVEIDVRQFPAAVTILDPALRGSEFTFSFATESGRHYTVECVDALNGGNWETLTNLTGEGSIAVIRDANGVRPHGFYRVEAQ